MIRGFGARGPEVGERVELFVIEHGHGLDQDRVVDALEDVGEALGGLGSMLGSTCFFIGGCCLLLLGLVLGLTINDKTQTVVVQGGGGGMVGMGAPVAGAPGGAFLTFLCANPNEKGSYSIATTKDINVHIMNKIALERLIESQGI